MEQNISLDESALTIGRARLSAARDAIFDRVRTASAATRASDDHWRSSSATAARAVVDDWAAEMKALLGLLDTFGHQLRSAEVAQELTQLDANRTLGDLARLMGAR